jgi:hypothetical protein
VCVRAQPHRLDALEMSAEHSLFRLRMRGKRARFAWHTLTQMKSWSLLGSGKLEQENREQG